MADDFSDSANKKNRPLIFLEKTQPVLAGSRSYVLSVKKSGII